MRLFLEFHNVTDALPGAAVLRCKCMVWAFLLFLPGNPVDRNITVNTPPVADAVYARRVYLDLWGVVPSPEELTAFQLDRNPKKREALADKLLADKNMYAGHWISFWNDHLRNEEGVIYHGGRLAITAWLRKALEDNLPYDQFVRALLNPVGQTDPAGFLTGVLWRGTVSASEIPPLQAAQNSAQVFVGVNLKCNSCHDSFISKWKLKDAYGLASFFSDGPLDVYRCDVPTGKKSEPSFLFPEAGPAPAADLPLAERRAAAARMFTAPENTRLSRTYVNRIWRRLLGVGIVEPVDDIDARPFNKALLDELSEGFTQSGYDPKWLLKTIMLSQAYQSPAVAESSERPYQFRGPLLRRMTAEQFADSISAITGEWRVRQLANSGVYAREWEMKSTTLTRALGRPIRDQVVTTRQDAPTTLQALELVNGNFLANMLENASLRMLRQLPLMPRNIYDSGLVANKPAAVDLDITGRKELWLLVEDSDSYDRPRVIGGWSGVQFIDANGIATKVDDMMGAIPAEKYFNVAGKGYTKLRATIGPDLQVISSDISPRMRFFVFAEKPNHAQLVNLEGEPPIKTKWTTDNAESLVKRLYLHALGRAPQAAELAIAKPMAATANGLEDLLWSVFISPEFEFIR